MTAGNEASKIQEHTNMPCGIYSITNKITNECYVGQSFRLRSRISSHKRRLHRNAHINKHLQSAWNKYGSKNFVFRVVEELSDDCTLKELTNAEQKWIDKLHPEYNKAPAAGSLLGFIWSEDSRNKLSKTLIGHIPWDKGLETPEKTKRKMSKAMKGRKLSEEHKKKIGDSVRITKSLKKLNK